MCASKRRQPLCPVCLLLLLWLLPAAAAALVAFAVAAGMFAAAAAVQVRAQATCAAISDTRTDVTINGAGLRVAGPLKVPLGVKGTGFVDWLYLDAGLRVTRGSKGSLFVHVRDDEADV